MAPIAPAPKFTKTQIKALIKKADAAGNAAGKGKVPVPMIVTQRRNAWDDNSPIVKTYAPVMGGVCGFGWVNIRPATSSLVRYMKTQEMGHPSYYGGWDIYAGVQFGQSMEKQEAWATAFAEVLREAGVNANARSRMD